jgi:hypothetical protein
MWVRMPGSKIILGVAAGKTRLPKKVKVIRPNISVIMGVAGGKVLCTTPKEMAKALKADLKAAEEDIPVVEKEIDALIETLRSKELGLRLLNKRKKDLARKIRVFEGTATEKELP